MPSTKTKVICYRADEEQADFLNRLPNKTEYIRQAIAAAIKQPCPLCQGLGAVSHETLERFKAQEKA